MILDFGRLSMSTTVKRVFLFVFFIIFLSSCSSNEPRSSTQKKQNKTKTNALPSALVKQQTSSTNLKQLASNNRLNPSQIRTIKIESAELAIQEKKNKTYIKTIVSSIDPNHISTIEEDLKLARIYLHIEQIESANLIANRLKQGALPAKYQISMWLLVAQIDSFNEQHLDTVRTLFRLIQLYPNKISDNELALTTQLIWRNVSLIPITTLNRFKDEFGPEANSWISLVALMNDFLNSPNEFMSQLNIWYKHHQQFHSFEHLPEQIQQLVEVTPYQINRIALILPFSGKLKKQALAIRNGFMASSSFDSDKQFIFIDSEKNTLAEIETLVIEKNVEFIVGPLLKGRISEFQTSELLTSIPRLNLNYLNNDNDVIDSEMTNKDEFFFSLAPEDEIAQAVEYFLSKKLEKPALIYADNSLGRRLSEQFSKLWFEQTQQELETIAYKSKSKLGEAVKDLLDVSASEKRIKEMEKLFGLNLKTQERSRTDIDAIYIIANSQQTRLIKPFFDVNVSVFGKKLPIYASSRSYVVGESNSEKRDLNGLTFTEMPWLLTNSNPTASDIYYKIGDSNTQLKKLFAFGYDASNLLPILKQLSILNQVSVKGLTGDLHLTSDKRIKRHLNWSQYRQGKTIVLKTIN